MKMKKKYFVTILILSILIAAFCTLTIPNSMLFRNSNLTITMEVRIEQDMKLQLYYLNAGKVDYSENSSVSLDVKATESFQKIKYELPINEIDGIRIDPEDYCGYVDIKNVTVSNEKVTKSISAVQLAKFTGHNINAVEVNDDCVTIFSNQEDPYISGIYEFHMDNYSLNAKKALIGLIMFCIVFVVLWKIRMFLKDIFKAIYSSKSQLRTLAVNDFKNRYTGSYLGRIWGVIQPLTTILLFWFVFQVGFRSQPMKDVPFILWLIAAMIPWNFFSDAWFSGNSAFTSYSYIVKKVVFNIDILPAVKICGSFILNIIFNIIILVVYGLYGQFPGIHIIDMIYFSICLSMLALGLSLITATLNVFMKDVGQLLSVIMQFLMWLTPIMWDYTMIPDRLSWFYRWNPLFYITNGYREALINGTWFFEEYGMMFRYWCFTFICLAVGYKLMKKLKPHFADVL